MSLIIPESSPIPRLSFSFNSDEQLLSCASSFNQNLFELLNYNQFSFDLQIDLDLLFIFQGLLSQKTLENIEDFFSTGFLGLKTSQLHDNLQYLNGVLKKHKNYITSLGISFEKLDNIENLKDLFQGLQHQNCLTSLRFALYKLSSNEFCLEFFNGLTNISHKITALTLEFFSSLSPEFEFPELLWSNFKFLKKLRLTFNDFNVPSSKSFFNGIGSLEHLRDFEVIFKGSSLNKELMMSFLTNFDQAEFKEMNNLSFEVFNECDNENMEKIFKGIGKKTAKLEGLSLGFSKNINFNTNGLKFLTELLENIAKNPGKLIRFGLKLMEDNLINDIEIIELAKAIGGLENIKTLELNFVNKTPGASLVQILKGLEKIYESLKTFKVFFGWNAITDEFGREIFKEIEKFKNLEYFLCDLSQNYSGSQYMNGNLAHDFIDSIGKLTNLKTLLVNIEGNEFKENHYCDIEAAIVQWKSEEKMPLDFFKIFRKSEIYGISQSEPNLIYFEEFSQHFPQNQAFNIDYNLMISNMTLEFNGCFFDNTEIIKKFLKFVKNLKVKTNNENVFLKLKNPTPIIDEIPTNKCPLKELFNQDLNEAKPPFSKINLIFTNLFQINEANPFKIKLDISHEKTDMKELQTAKETLNYLSTFSSISMNTLLENPKNFEAFARNRILAYILSPIRFEEIYKMIPPHHIEKQVLFVNSVFSTSLIYDFPSKIPSFLASKPQFAKQLTPEVLSLLNFYCKTLKELQEKSPKVHKEKLESFEELKLKANHNFSIQTWKEKIFKEFEKTWISSFLKTPKDFMENTFFEVSNSKNSLENDLEIKTNINNKYEEFKDLFSKLDFPGLGSYYEAFLEELVLNLPNLKRIDFQDLLGNLDLKQKFTIIEKKNLEEEKKQDFLKEENPKKLEIIEDFKESEEDSSLMGEALKSQDLIFEEKQKKTDEFDFF